MVIWLTLEKLDASSSDWLVIFGSIRDLSFKLIAYLVFTFFWKTDLSFTMIVFKILALQM